MFAWLPFFPEAVKALTLPCVSTTVCMLLVIRMSQRSRGLGWFLLYFHTFHLFTPFAPAYPFQIEFNLDQIHGKWVRQGRRTLKTQDGLSVQGVFCMSVSELKPV